MRAYDLSPLFRSTIGFDRVSDMIDAAFKIDERAVSYPPYNIVRTGEDSYQIVMAVAGFKQHELTITSQANLLVVTGSHAEAAQDEKVAYLHRGIANRSFERKFQLADHVKVADASLADGLLTLHLVREVPEESKPRTIAIKADGGKTLEHQA